MITMAVFETAKIKRENKCCQPPGKFCLVEMPFDQTIPQSFYLFIFLNNTAQGQPVAQFEVIANFGRGNNK